MIKYQFKGDCMIRSFTILLTSLFLILIDHHHLIAQTKPTEGIRKNIPSIHAFINAHIIVSSGKVIQNGTVVIRDGIIESVGEEITPPQDAKVWDLKGFSVYPGFIESFFELESNRPSRTAAGAQSPEQPGVETREKPGQGGAKYWNEYVNARQNSEELYSPDEKKLEKLRSQGFTSALIVPPDAIFRGSSSLINLAVDEPNNLIIKKNIAQHLSFERGSGQIGFFGGYPNSLMGVIALIRQVFYDVQWYRKANEIYLKNQDIQKPEYNEDLTVLDKAIRDKIPFIFEVNDEINFLRAAKILKEFSLPSIFFGSGYEYRRLESIKKIGAPIILPLNFPEAPTVETSEDALNVSYSDLRHWNSAPKNPRIITEAGIPICFSSAKLKDPSNFLIQLRKTVDNGLTPEAALNSLTIIPAKLFGVDRQIGSIEKGKIANLVITDGDLFNEKTKIIEVWVSGKKYEVKPKSKIDLRGTWSLQLKLKEPLDTGRLILKGDIEKPEGSLIQNKKQIRLTGLNITSLQIAFRFQGDTLGYPGSVRMTGNITDKEIIGIGELPTSEKFLWSSSLLTPFEAKIDTNRQKIEKSIPLENVYPPIGFGRKTIPDQPEYLIVKNVTIWTSGPQGTLKDADLIIKNGKIQQIGRDLISPKNSIIIDAKGKHVTPGIIDCHSHTAISGNVNEGGQAITSETRIEDVIDCNDIAIYRELAGGTTMANVLHGSANPIGGQNAIIKLRWGTLPDEMILEGFPKGLKFALGENVKQSNSSERQNPRYPQTRMGVEQIISDEFQAAIDYKKVIAKYDDDGVGLPPRRDLELEPIVEVLEGKRFAHVHAYRQDEILMLMRLAEKYNFKISTFQHVLEGYKVADILLNHGAGASSFSDWWAYKFEVYDAIPYNGVIMDKVGVSVSYNSDSDELARRLNLEAAKAVKYGGLLPEQALKFVTINPAKQLKIDTKVGSLEVGKDADFVIWSGDPLSTYTICEQTWIDGRKYFDREEDLKMREEIQKERSLLIQKILSLKKDERMRERPSFQSRPGNNKNVQDEESESMEVKP
jgi:imidazolonepropionase-like amidohydrolase